MLHYTITLTEPQEYRYQCTLVVEGATIRQLVAQAVHHIWGPSYLWTGTHRQPLRGDIVERHYTDGSLLPGEEVRRIRDVTASVARS